MQVSKSSQKLLINWYAQNARPLPWRKTKDPYKIWISEVMLQQTVAAAVIPFYERFLLRFPDVTTLAHAHQNDVLEVWSGLGYYTRARNLQKAAKEIDQMGFPTSYQQLIHLPGFGPYTSRSVSSIAFDESVGVLDGNVIRVLSRFHNLKLEWWKPKIRDHLQTMADKWVRGVSSATTNQALMELGATICTPQSPACLLCPLQKSCSGFSHKTTTLLPLKKPRKQKEIWLWKANVITYKNKLAVVTNRYAPFLKNQILLPGTTKKLSSPPKKFDYKHNVTHYEIYVKTNLKALNSIEKMPKTELEWIHLKNIKKRLHLSLIQKALRLHFS